MTRRSRSHYLQLACLFLAIVAATLGCGTAEQPAAEPVPTPSASVAAEPVEPVTIMLAIDISLSMLAEDTTPSRFGAATQALDAFLDTVPAETYVGLVSFHGIASLEVAPTTDRAEVRSAIPGRSLSATTPKTG